MLRRLVADVMISDPADVNPGVAALIEAGFDVELREDWIDDFGPTVFVLARITTDKTDGEIFKMVKALVEPLGGDCNEVGYDGDLRPAAAWDGDLRAYHRNRLH